MNRERLFCLGLVILALSAASTLAGCGYDTAESAEPAQEERTAEAVEGVTMSCPVGAKCGLTWVKESHTNATGQDKVSCHDSSATPSNSCNPYTGDTDCKLSRPLLCIRKDGSASNGFVGSFYNGWAAGNIGITHPTPGTSLTSLAVANSYCVKEFGAGWQMAEHHDGGGGWAWTAYGNLNDVFTATRPSHKLTDRFWVYVNDQPQGNCW